DPQGSLWGAWNRLATAQGSADKARRYWPGELISIVAKRAEFVAKIIDDLDWVVRGCTPNPMPIPYVRQTLVNGEEARLTAGIKSGCQKICAKVKLKMDDKKNKPIKAAMKERYKFISQER